MIMKSVDPSRSPRGLTFIRSQDPTRFVCRNFLFSKDKPEYDINWPDPDENGRTRSISSVISPVGIATIMISHPSAVIFGWGLCESRQSDLMEESACQLDSWFIGGTTGVNGVSWQYRGECGWPGTLCGMGPSGFHFDICGFPYVDAYLNGIVYKILNHKNETPDLVILVKSSFRDGANDFEEIPSWTWPVV